MKDPIGFRYSRTAFLLPINRNIHADSQNFSTKTQGHIMLFSCKPDMRDLNLNTL